MKTIENKKYQEFKKLLVINDLNITIFAMRMGCSKKSSIWAVFNEYRYSESIRE